MGQKTDRQRQPLQFLSNEKCLRFGAFPYVMTETMHLGFANPAVFSKPGFSGLELQTRVSGSGLPMVNGQTSFRY